MKVDKKCSFKGNIYVYLSWNWLQVEHKEKYFDKFCLIVLLFFSHFFEAKSDFTLNDQLEIRKEKGVIKNSQLRFF